MQRKQCSGQLLEGQTPRSGPARGEGQQWLSVET